MNNKAKEILKIFRPQRVIIPIVLGVGVAAYMLWRNFDGDAFSKVSWGWSTVIFLFFALLMMVIRDLGYMWRIRILTSNRISWRNSFDVIMLWEFASAITPSVVGGSAVAMFIVNREGISLGRSSAIVLITALMDELFFVLMVPLLYLMVGEANLFPISMQKEIFGISLNIKGLFWLSYYIIVLYVLVITYALIFKPRGFKWILLKIFKLPLLKKNRFKALQTGNEIESASAEIKSKNFFFWFKAFIATFFSWTARYWVVNFLILAFLFQDQFLSLYEHFLIYGRQLVMWIIMLISPTPGGAGIAEFAFAGFLKEFTPHGLEEALALGWRLISYYPYLFIGTIILPRWLNRVFPVKKKEPETLKTD